MDKPKVQLSMAIRNKIAKPFLTGLVRNIVIAQFLKYKSLIMSEQAIFSMLSISKTLSSSLVAEALTGLIYHRPPGENSSFQRSLEV